MSLFAMKGSGHQQSTGTLHVRSDGVRETGESSRVVINKSVQVGYPVAGCWTEHADCKSECVGGTYGECDMASGIRQYQ